MIKTLDELKSDWGLIRFVEGLQFLSNWYLTKNIPITEEEIEELLNANKDAFEIFMTQIYYNE